ncbi:fetuin-B isoform X1 [Denticeps clupeoides]|uniref:Cystatin fetuin-B-type domain-containing protein n=1 Tax=Denticeps clupeoides TaxID=299321 RepID=A0AAY4BBZ9_9TELE|nr:fetuin-B-like isoform X1 [Denticeps clupeoides]
MKMASREGAGRPGLLWILPIVSLLARGSTQVVELTPVPCDDRTVERLARLAVTYTNEDRGAGYKFALNRVANVHLHAQGPAGKVYYLDLDVLETKCHVKSPKTWKHCDVRPFMETQISGNCNITVLHTVDGFSYLYSYDCTLVPDPPEKLQMTCPACPLLLHVDSHEAQSLALLTLNKYKQQSTLPITLGLHTITRASSQSGATPASFVEYTIADCAAELPASGFCNPENAGIEAIGFCVGAVFGQKDFQQHAQVSCEIFHPQRIPNTGGPIAGPEPPIDHPADRVPPAVGPEDDGLLDHVQHIPFPYDQQPLGTPSTQLASSESSESESMSSEETGVRISRPPLDFHYKPYRKKRQAAGTGKPTHTPVFLTLFPSGVSPFRSCPGPSRYTTV